MISRIHSCPVSGICWVPASFIIGVGFKVLKTIYMIQHSEYFGAQSTVWSGICWVRASDSWRTKRPLLLCPVPLFSPLLYLAMEIPISSPEWYIERMALHAILQILQCIAMVWRQTYICVFLKCCSALFRIYEKYWFLCLQTFVLVIFFFSAAQNFLLYRIFPWEWPQNCRLCGQKFGNKGNCFSRAKVNMIT